MSPQVQDQLLREKRPRILKNFIYFEWHVKKLSSEVTCVRKNKVGGKANRNTEQADEICQN